MRVIVAGAGVGGLSAALSLHESGIDVEVIDSAELPPPGWTGTHLLPPAVRELAGLGLGDDLAAAGVRVTELAHFDVHGSRIWGQACGRDAGDAWPQYSIGRGALLQILNNAVRSRIGPWTVRQRQEVVSFEEADGAVTVRIRDRVTGTPQVLNADALVGTDGLYSKVRMQLHPGDPAPRWDGITVWRGVTAAAPFLTGRTIAVCGDNANLKFVAYPIRAPAEPGGLAEICWAADVKTTTAPGCAPHMDWTQRGRIEDVLPLFAGWVFDWLDVPALIGGAAHVVTYPMVDRDPLPQWGTGSVTLLGYTAHPMYPVGLSGVSQVVIDGRVLANHLARAESAQAGLAAYETARRRPANDLILACRNLPVDPMLRSLRLRAPDGFDQVSDVLTAAEIAAFDDAYLAMMRH